MKRLAKKILNNCGFDIVRFPEKENVHDLRSTAFNPYSVLYRVKNKDSVLSELSLSDARDPFFRSYSKSFNHPYVYAAEQAIGSPDATTVISNALRDFYDQDQAGNVASYLGIEHFGNATLIKLKPYEFVWPWETSTVKEKVRIEHAQVRRVPKKELGYRDLNISYGWKFSGPVSEELILNESLRLSNLLMNIMQRGYLRHDNKDGDVVASILEHQNGNWRWNISSGMHRAAVLSATGHSKIPVRIRGIIRQTDVSVWPNVMNGLYSVAEAEQVFLNLYNAFRTSTSL